MSESSFFKSKDIVDDSLESSVNDIQIKMLKMNDDEARNYLEQLIQEIDAMRGDF